jgi:hypothetical protein
MKWLKVVSIVMEHLKSIELSVDAARSILPVLEGQLQELKERAWSAQSDYDKAEKTIAEIRLKLNGSLLPGITDAKKRKRRGEGEKVIIDLLSSSSGGFKLQEVVKRTGIPYSSVFRLLKQKNKGRFIEENGLWKMKK